MSYEITFTKTISEQFVRDTMVTMVESGNGCVHYWADVIDIDRAPNLDVTRIVLVDAEQLNEASDKYDMPPSTHTIDGDRIVAAMSAILDGKANLVDYIVKYIRDAVTEDDAGYIDAEAADAIAQYIVHESIVYG